MEEIQPPQAGFWRKYRLGIALLVLCCAGIALLPFIESGALVRLTQRALGGKSAPLTTLQIRMLTPKRQEIPPRNSRIGEAAAPSETPTPSPTASLYGWMKRPSPTPVPAQLAVDVVRMPLALSFYAQDGRRLYRFLMEHRQAREFLNSELARGALAEIISTANVRGEDLKIGSLQGSLIAPLAEELFGAGAALHYDFFRGRSGFVLSFERAKAPKTSALLTLLVPAITKRELAVPRAGLRVAELLLGRQRFFFVEDRGRCLVSTGLTALLNILEQGEPPRPAVEAASLSLVLRAEAFLDQLLPLLTGAEEWQLRWDVPLDASQAAAGKLAFDPASAFGRLSPELASGVLASIPRDSFAALAAGLELPPHMTLEDWALVPTKGLQNTSPPAQRAGIGLIWDLHAKEKLSSVGIIVSRRPGVSSQLALKDYVSTAAFSAGCAGDSVWLAASSELLLNRMREGCEGQSLSLRDTLEASPGVPFNAVLLFNPVSGLDQMLQAGIPAALADHSGGEAVAPVWKTQYLAAVENARGKARRSLAILPALLFRGSLNAKGGTLDGQTIYLGVH